MAHFIGKVQGARGQASRLGHKSSGIQVQAQGWAIGARAMMKHDDKHGDIACFFLTNSSSDCSGELLLEISQNGDIYMGSKLKALLEAQGIPA